MPACRLYLQVGPAGAWRWYEGSAFIQLCAMGQWYEGSAFIQLCAMGQCQQAVSLWMLYRRMAVWGILVVFQLGIAPGTTSAMSVPIQCYTDPHPPNVASAAPERPLIGFKPGELRHKGIKRTAQHPMEDCVLKMGT